MDYGLIKHIHVSCAIASGSFFFLRGIWMLQASPRLQARWVRVSPHVIDAVLLASAIAMALLSHQYPGQLSWLSAKLLALLVYIGLGMIALKRGRTYRGRAVAWVAALAVFGYIVSVALTRTPLPFL